MSREELEQIMTDLIKQDINYDRLDGLVAMLLERFQIENGVTLSIVLYSGLIAFAFNESEPAMELIQDLMNNYSSFELYNKAITLLGQDIVEYYKDILLSDYTINQQPLVKALDKMTSELDGNIEDFMESYDDLKGLLPEEQ